ncbi:MAG TPA: nucleotidyltransferase domain-containing protein [Chitinophagales bacterium]|nr:nucleotidyltransferase domain-containing protein [Chitinophagales bacterium]
MKLDLQDIESKIISLLTSTANVKAIYLYGSIITEYFNSESDIDIAVLLDKKIDFLELFELNSNLAKELGKDIDLVQLDNVSTVLQFQVIQNGKRIFCNDEKYCNRYESQIFCEYIELNELRKPYLDEIAKTGKVLS